MSGISFCASRFGNKQQPASTAIHKPTGLTDQRQGIEMSNQAYNEIYGSRTDGAPMGGANQPNQESMLGAMRDRLTSLSDEARSIRSQVPHEFEPDVQRIQEQMQRLSERLSDLSRGALVPYNAAQRVHERRVKVVRYVTEDDVRVARARPDQIISLGAPGSQRGFGSHDANGWDEASANALVELYESGEAFAATLHREAVAAGSNRANMQIASRSISAPTYAVAGMIEAPQAGASNCSMDKNMLDQRFAEIAARIEQSLSQIRPEAALASLGRRFDQLEAQINTMFGQMATRADLEELRLAEEQIEEIASQLSQFRSQMARLDLIDAHLGTLTSQLSDERLTRLFNDSMQAGGDAGRFDLIDAQLRMIAVQLSDERLSGLVTRSASRGLDYDEVADAAAKRVAASMVDLQARDAQARDIGEVRGMLESLINERRHNDENNASMLETMQQAIIRVLDRIDTLELAQQQNLEPASVPAPQRTYTQATPPAEPSYRAEAVPPAMPAASAPAPSYDDLVPATATVFAEMPATAEDDASDFLPVDGGISQSDMQAYREDTASEHTLPHAPVYTSTGFDLDAAFSRARDDEALSFGEPQPAKPSLDVLRHDFIADAHRAKLKAASKPDSMLADSGLRSAELSTGSREAEAKPRRRSIFSFRSQRVAMSLLVLLAAIPAAIFFMPRTSSSHEGATPAAATVAPAPKRAEQLPVLPQIAPTDAEPMLPAGPDAVPPATNAPSRQTNQAVPPYEQQGSKEYEDVHAPGSAIDTASLPDGIMMQPATASGQQLVQMNEQARAAYMSSQLGIAAAKATPASLMEEQILREHGANATADAQGNASKLPPATVGPFSMRLAAAQGDASAQFEVASRLAEGKGTDQDLAEAAQWYQRAAANGFPMAQFRLGTLYERGLGVKVDLQRAQIWYERAAAQGNVKAMHNLAVLIASRGPKGDYKTAAQWFTNAANYGLSDSQFNLAVLYENGMGVSKSLPQAYKWLILAAKSGDKDAAARRDALKAKLNAEELAVAETEASTWTAKPITGMANDPRLAGQAWRDASRG